MKIYRRTEFMRLPEGVLFSKGKPWYWNGLNVKGDAILDGNLKPIDFSLRGLISIDSHDSGQLAERFDLMLEDGASFPMEEAYGRDGFFDDEDLFLIWERADLEEMQRVIADAIAANGPDKAEDK